MDTQHIKIGETYLLPVTVTVIEKRGWLSVATGGGYGYSLAPSEVKSLLQNGIKNTETAPKYDPCRKFREGDNVRVIRRDGRIGSPSIKIGATAIVEESEDDDNLVVLRNPSPKGQPFICIRSYFLELITPVEELCPYSVTYSTDTSEECGRFEVVRGEQCVSIYPYGTHETRYYKKAEHAKAAAEAERDRLNAEHRKEQK